MSKDLENIIQYIRFHKYFYIVLYIIVYFLVFPYCLYLASIELYDKEIVLFASLQKYLILPLLLYYLIFIKNYVEGSLKELLHSLDSKKKIRLVFYMYILVILSISPCLIISLYFYPKAIFYILWLLIEILIIYTLFHLFSYMFNSVLISYGIIFIYLSIITEVLSNNSILSLVRLNGFREVNLSYYVFWFFIMISSIVLSYIIEIKRRNKV